MKMADFSIFCFVTKQIVASQQREFRICPRHTFRVCSILIYTNIVLQRRLGIMDVS